ncbi:MAG: Phage minor capsid protein 2 [Methanosaeta sp. PtaB.Bin039]|nr:MAG: Phage minor capsid protein 2 [Methanosaeta sp. PtaB.Bin039]
MVPVGHPQRGACPAIVALETIRGDIVGFQTWKQVAKAYREKLAEKGVTGFKDAAGRDWDLRRYTEMVARTTTREVMIQGTANRLLEHGHDLAVIIGGVGSNTCEVCKAWVGRTVSLTGKTQGYPTLDDARAEGFMHPNCTHNIATAMTFEGEIAKAVSQKIRDAEPEEFIRNRDKLPADLWSFLSPYTAEDYKAANVRLRMHESGTGGYGLKGNELISVFSLPGAHLGDSLVKDAVANGAKRLDCLGEDLVNLYKRNGFK